MKQSAAALIISILGFVLSGISTYFSLIRQTENVDEVVFQAPDLAVEDNKVFVHGPYGMALVNRGTRTTAVLGIDLVLIQREKENEEACAYGALAELTIKHDAFVIPANDVVLVNIDIARTELQPPAEGGFNWKPKSILWDACVRVETVAPIDRTGLEQSTAFFGQYLFDPQNRMPGSAPNSAEITDFRASTHRLFSHTRTIFD